MSPKNGFLLPFMLQKYTITPLVDVTHLSATLTCIPHPTLLHPIPAIMQVKVNFPFSHANWKEKKN